MGDMKTKTQDLAETGRKTLVVMSQSSQVSIKNTKRQKSKKRVSKIIEKRETQIAQDYEIPLKVDQIKKGVAFD